MKQRASSTPAAWDARALLGVAFFLSGTSAILYQILWQRALFTIFGTSSEAVTLVVTAFMLGLGLGSLVGGALSESERVRPVVAFGVIEAAVGLFGLASLELFRWVGERSVHARGLEIGLTSFALLMVPTLLMGATLPLLASHAVRASGNVGASLGELYSLNTLGSAIGALAASHFLMARLGQIGSIRLAAALNLAVAVIVLWRARRTA